MHASHAGPLANYNSLLDENLAGFFTDHRRFKHLRRMGLVTRDGRIVDEGIIRMNAARKQHKHFSRDLLADTIVTKAVELERKRRADLKKKLEHLEKIEKVEKVKSQRCHPVGVQDFNPYRRAPPPPPRLSKTFETHIDDLGLSLDQISEVRHAVGRISRNRGIPPRVDSPYTSHSLVSCASTPTVHSPRPPSNPRPTTPRKSRATVRDGRRSRPHTAPVGGRRSHGKSAVNQSSPLRAQRHSDVQITLRYVGKGIVLEGSSLSEVLVLQQHCGGNTIQLYKDRVRPRDHFTFTSKRHIGMPFGLTLYLDGMMDSRISACCEYRHQCGKLLGSKTAHFRLLRVEGGKPCYRCEIERDRKEMKRRQQAEVDSVLNNPVVSPREDNLEVRAIDEQPSTSTQPFGLTSQSDIISSHRTHYYQQESHTAPPNDDITQTPPHVTSQADIEELKSPVATHSHSPSPSPSPSSHSIESVEEEKSNANSHGSLDQEDTEQAVDLETESLQNTPSHTVVSQSSLHSQDSNEHNSSTTTVPLAVQSVGSGIYSTSAQTNLLDVQTGGDAVGASAENAQSVTVTISETDHHNLDYSEYDDDVFEEDTPDPVDHEETDTTETEESPETELPGEPAAEGEGEEEIESVEQVHTNKHVVTEDVEPTRLEQSTPEATDKSVESGDISNRDTLSESQHQDELEANEQQASTTETNTVDIPAVIEPNNEEKETPKTVVKTGEVSEDQLLDAPPSVVVIAATPDSEQNAIDKFKFPADESLQTDSNRDSSMATEASEPTSGLQEETQNNDTEVPPGGQNVRPSILHVVTNKTTSNKTTPLRSVSFSELKTPSMSPTLADASKILQKITSNTSLGSILNDHASIDSESRSVVDLSGSEDDELIPDLEKQITQLEHGVDGYDHGTERDQRTDASRDEESIVKSESTLDPDELHSNTAINIDSQSELPVNSEAQEVIQTEASLLQVAEEKNSSASNDIRSEPTDQKTVLTDVTVKEEITERQTNSVKSSLSSSLSNSSLTSVSSNTSML